MTNWLDNVLEKIKNLNHKIENYKKETVIQSLPAVAFVNRAKKMFEAGNYLEAKLILDKAMELPQKDARVLKYQGMVEEKLGNPEKAVEYYQDSAELNPNDKNIWQKLGFALIAVNKFVEAEKSFENSNKINASNTDTHTGWGMALMKQHRYAEAREKFIEAARINRYNFSTIFLAAVMDMRLNELDKAETRLAFLANVSPNESNTYEYAHLKFIKQDYENALFYAKKSLEYNPSMLPSYILIANTYTINWDFENTIKTFKQAEQKELSSLPLYLEWALALETFDCFEDAKQKLIKAQELKQDEPDVIANLALCNFMTGDYDTAQNLTEQFPEHFASRLTKALLIYLSDNIDDAISKLRELSEEKRDFALIDFYLAQCFQKQKNDTKVKDFYNSTIDKNPKYFRAYKEYAKYLFAQNNFADAQRKLRKAHKLDENNLEILNLLFYSCYKLVKDNVCEYNIKEALGFAEKAENLGHFEYPEEKNELTELLKNIQDR